MLRAVLFDLDGTLFDRVTTVSRCVTEQHARFADALTSVPADLYLSRFLELEGRGYVKKDVVYDELVREFALAPELAERLYADFYQYYHRHAVGFPGLHQLLGHLKECGLKLGLITNGGESHQRSTIAALAIEPYFDAILISEVEGVRKPDVLIFRRAIDRLDATCGEALFVGDHPDADIGGARAAGLRTVWKRDHYWGDCDTAEFIIDDLEGLLQVLRLPEIAGSGASPST